MGQAKKRGTFEERQAAAIKRKAHEQERAQLLASAKPAPAKPADLVPINPRQNREKGGPLMAMLAAVSCWR